MEEQNKQKKQEFFTYKGKPLVRCGDTIFYGDMNDSHVIKLDIKSKTDSNGMNIADEVSVQLILTDPDVSLRKKIVKTSKKKGLYLALDIADVWLERALIGK